MRRYTDRRFELSQEMPRAQPGDFSKLQQGQIPFRTTVDDFLDHHDALLCGRQFTRR
ncbi:hypothetical protein MKleb_5408 (plasmid) [Klebsiella sp. PL-2018]|nr:hypothetical protein MKleb_5408 [Klebsiella sp. PL-2018]